MLKNRYENIQFDIDDLREIDYLDNLVYAKNLFQKMKDYYDSDKKTPLYVAVTGTWGSGKTTVVKTAIKMLKEKIEVKEFIYDAWKYEGDSFRRTFTKCILDSSGIDKTTKKYKSIYNKMYDDKSIEKESIIESIELSKHVDTSYNNIWLIIMPAIIALVFYIVSTLVQIERAKEIFKYITIITSIVGATTIIKALVTFFGKFMTARVTYVFQKLFSPEQFYETMNEILEEVEIENKLILIDNVDRCNIEELKNTISSIKGFFGENKKIIYIIPFDFEQMSKAYENEYEGYSEKVFDYTLDLREKSAKNIIDFIDKLTTNKDEYKDLFTSSSSDIISRSKCKTPRQILNICNDYITEYNIYVEKNKLNIKEIESEDLDYLMKYTILKRYHNDFFRRMHKDIEIIKQLEYFASIRRSYEDVLEDFSWLDESLYLFLRKTSSTKPRNYNYYYSSQSNDDFEIDEEIRQLIDSEEFEKVNEIMKNSEIQKNIILKYMSKRIKYDKIRNIWKPSIISKLKLLVFLMKEKTIDKNEFFKYFDFIMDDSLFRNILYPLELSVEDIVIFLNTIDNKNKYDPINEMLNGLIRGQVKIDESNKYNIISIFLSELNIKNMDNNQKSFLNRHIDYLISNHLYSKIPHIELLKNNIVNYVDIEKIYSLLDSTQESECECFDILTEIVNNRVKDRNDGILIGKYVELINRIDKNIITEEQYNKIFGLFYKNFDIEDVKNQLNNVSINVIPEDKLSNKIIDMIYEMYKETEYSNLNSILLSVNSSDNIKYVFNIISKEKELLEINMELSKQLIIKMTDEQFEINFSAITKIYDKYEENYQMWYNEYINNRFPNKIDKFYDMLKNHEYKDKFAEYITGLSLSFEERISKIKFFMTSNERFNLLIQNENSIQQLEKIIDNCDMHYKKMVEAKLVDIIEGKDSLYGDDIDCVICLLKNNKINVNCKKKILKAIGVQKTNLEDLKRIYDVLSPSLKTIKQEHKLIESYLIENGIIENHKENKSTDTKIKVEN